MKKTVLIALTGILLLTACNSSTIRKGQYSGEDISTKAVILKDSKLKTTQIKVELNSPWKLYAGTSVDSIDFSNPIVSGNEAGTFTVDIPFLPRQYFQLTSSNGNAIFSERHLPMEGGYNFRDLGGYPTGDGRFVKWGMLFRTDDMYNLTETDLDYLSDVGLCTVVDFRSENEVEAAADKFPATAVNHVLLPIFPGNLSQIRYDNMDPALFKNYMNDMYASFCTDENIIDQYRQFFALLQDETKIPLSFHCSAGKDRTGIGAALFLYSLGVSEDIIIQDYLLSNQYLEGKYAALVAETPEFKIASRVEAEYMQITLSSIKENYGSVENYLENSLNVDIAKMKSMYLY